jgi:hypothetical protein
MYGKLDLHEPDKKEDAIDASGYTGVFHRKKIELKPISEQDFVKLIAANNKLKDIFFKIREIDRFRNGFVTELELDDIIKIVYDELIENDIGPIIKPFCCKENKILIDYKKFREHVNSQLQGIQNHKEPVQADYSNNGGSPSRQENSAFKEKI